jgi:hypothetical protein
MPAQIKNDPPTRARARRTNKPTLPPTKNANPDLSGRTADGRFAKDNPGGPGNPHARHCARILALLRASISDEEMVAIIRALVVKAVDGDTSAAKLILSYKLGKPAPAPNPDEIERDEWEHYQRDTINLEDVQQVLGSLPSSVGNNLARTALPVMTQARKEEIASQLGKNEPVARKVTTESEFATDKPRKSAPIPIGSSGPNESSIHDPRRADASTLAFNGSRSTIHEQRAMTNDVPPPIPNRKSGTGRSGKTKAKKIKPHWVQQVARKIR